MPVTPRSSPTGAGRRRRQGREKPRVRADGASGAGRAAGREVEARHEAAAARERAAQAQERAERARAEAAEATAAAEAAEAALAADSGRPARGLADVPGDDPVVNPTSAPRRPASTRNTRSAAPADR